MTAPSSRYAYQKRQREAVRGRCCEHCLVDDSEVGQFQTATECTACYRAKMRNGLCERCGAVNVVLGSRSKRETLCPRCDAEEFRARGRVQIILLSPAGTPERERTIWRRRESFAWGPWARTLGLAPKQIRESDVLCVEATPAVWSRYRR